MEAVEYLYAYTPEEYKKVYNEIKDETASFDIVKFYNKKDSIGFVVITPNQLIAVPTNFHRDAGLKVYDFLYNFNDYSQTRNIVIILSNLEIKVFNPYFPSKAINSFQAEVFLHFLEKLEEASNEGNYLINDSETAFEDLKEKFDRIPIDDDFIPPEENIFSVTREDWNEKHKVA